MDRLEHRFLEEGLVRPAINGPHPISIKINNESGNKINPSRTIG